MDNKFVTSRKKFSRISYARIGKHLYLLKHFFVFDMDASVGQSRTNSKFCCDFYYLLFLSLFLLYTFRYIFQHAGTDERRKNISVGKVYSKRVGMSQRRALDRGRLFGLLFFFRVRRFVSFTDSLLKKKKKKKKKSR